MEKTAEDIAFEKMRFALAEAACQHAPFDGWGDAALAHGAADLGLAASDCSRYLPGGAAEAILLINQLADAQMVQAMAQQDLDAMRVRDRIALGVRTRLQQNAAHQEAIRRAMTFLALPTQSGIAMKALYRTVDSLWRAAGDTSTDHNFYTKRALLAGVYSSTLLYWLNDKSEDQRNTWEFLDRRIDDVMKIPGSMAKMRGRLSAVPTPFSVFRAFRDFRPTSPRSRS